MAAYRTRGASVKVNMVLSEAAGLRGADRGGLQAPAHRRRQLLPVARLPRARLAGRRPRRPRREPLRRDRGPVLDRPVAHRRRPLDRDDVHPVRAAPSTSSGRRARARSYADTCVENMAQFAPNLPGAIEEREVLAPPDLEDIFGLVDGSIFQGEQDIAQMAFMRPSPMLAQYATPARGPLPLRRRHPPGRRRDGGERPQRRPADPQGPAAPRRSARPAGAASGCGLERSRAAAANVQKVRP